MKNFSPLCSIVMFERLKTSTVNFITSHPGLSYIFLQEVSQFSFGVSPVIFPKTVTLDDCVGCSFRRSVCLVVLWVVQVVIRVQQR